MSAYTIEFERNYIVPFYPKLNSIPRNKRAPRAVRLLKEFIKRHMKVDDDQIYIGQEVNEFIWRRGIQKPPRKIPVRLVKYSDGVVEVNLATVDAKAVTKPTVSAPSGPIESEISEDEEEEEEEE
ncbi:MAG: 50S ribosomal protein L31e [Methanobacteriota archaeon]|nr:MAG: 50S ribosomal protein L31e [Euryarchaeota archaeon]